MRLRNRKATGTKRRTGSQKAREVVGAPMREALGQGKAFGFYFKYNGKSPESLTPQSDSN